MAASTDLSMSVHLSSISPLLAPLSPELLHRVHSLLGARDAIALAFAGRMAREELCCGPAAAACWKARTLADFGPGAPALAAHAVDSLAAGSSRHYEAQTTISRLDMYKGFIAYSTCVQLQRRFVMNLERVNGSVAEHAGGATCVACPVLTDLFDAGIGAQGAVRAAAGPDLEEFIDKLVRDLGGLEPLDVVLAPGGNSAQTVALTVTEFTGHGSLDDFLLKLHRRVLAAARSEGHRSLAMPTLGTGGMGYSASRVCEAVCRAAAEDFILHPQDPLHVRICCFEQAHLKAMKFARCRAATWIFEERPCRVAVAKKHTQSYLDFNSVALDDDDVETETIDKHRRWVFMTEDRILVWD